MINLVAVRPCVRDITFLLLLLPMGMVRESRKGWISVTMETKPVGASTPRVALAEIFLILCDSVSHVINELNSRTVPVSRSSLLSGRQQ